MGFDGRFRVRMLAGKFFLQAKLFDNALDTSRADLHAGLSEFLRDDISRSVRVKESMPNDLTCRLLRRY